MEGIGKGVISAIVLLCIICVVSIWGGWELIDIVFIDDTIRSRELITPELELTIKDNVVDTFYVYRNLQ
jgi:hypothetical protein|tara:strand:+ start:410 stop:616 length:207 start_codon:yes stop_codon:yes gene_type:complete